MGYGLLSDVRQSFDLLAKSPVEPLQSVHTCDDGERTGRKHGWT